MYQYVPVCTREVRVMTRQESYRECNQKALWNRCALPESRVVKVNADLLAFEALPNYIAITTAFKLACLKTLRFDKN